jgi:rubrerythrin
MATHTEAHRREREELIEEEEVADEEELASLLALADLDLEAAMVHEMVAEAVDERDLKSLLTSFAEDHRRHLEELERLVREQGGKVEERRERVGGILMTLASTIGATDTEAAVEALIANEQLTNATCETAMWVISMDAAQNVLKKSAADEQRHLRSLLDYQRKIETDGEDVED